MFSSALAHHLLSPRPYSEMHTAVPSHGRAPGGSARPPDQLLIQTALSYQAAPAGGLTHTTGESFDPELIHILTLN